MSYSYLDSFLPSKDNHSVQKKKHDNYFFDYDIWSSKESSKTQLKWESKDYKLIGKDLML